MRTDIYTPDLPPLSADRLQARKRALLAEVEQHANDARSSRRGWAGISGRLGARKPGWTRVRWAVGGAALASAAAVAAVVATSVGPGGTPAFASWTPTPAAADPAAVSPLVDQCQSRLADSPAFAGKPVPQRLVAAEHRGDLTAVVLDNPQHPDGYGACLKLASGDLIAGTGGQPRRWPSSSVSIINGPTMVHQDEGAATLLGRVEPAVAAVTVTTFGGQQVTATVSNGWFFAWWPIAMNNIDYSGARTLTVVDANGNQLEEIEVQTVPVESIPTATPSPRN